MIRVKVEPTHIENGVYSNEHKCPVALALEEATGHKWNVGLFDIIDETENKAYATPFPVKNFIRHYDDVLKVKGFKLKLQPFWFFLNKPYNIGKITPVMINGESVWFKTKELKNAGSN